MAPPGDDAIEESISQVRLLNKALAATPYSFPEDEAGEKRVKTLLELCRSIDLRQARIRERFAKETADIRDRIDLFVGTTMVYESNALEQAGLPLDQTRDVVRETSFDELDRLATELAKSALLNDKHMLEVVGLHQSTIWASELASEFGSKLRPFTEVDLRNLHRLATRGETFAGEYRTKAVGIGGKHRPLQETIDGLISGEGLLPGQGETDNRSTSQAGVEFSSPAAISAEMSDLVEWINSYEVNPALAACVAHSWLAYVHPFEDGNGRVARLLANLVLMRASWPPLVIRETDRLQYLDALAHSDEGSDLLPVFDLFVISIKRHLRHIEKPDLAERLFDADLQRSPGERFELWSNMVTDLLNRIREQLDVSPTRAEVRDVLGAGEGLRMFRLFVPRLSTLLQIEQGDKGGNAWLAKVFDRSRIIDHLIWLGHSSQLCNLDDTLPSLFFGVRDKRSGARRPYRNPWDYCPFKVKEVVIRPSVGETPFLLRYEGQVTEWVNAADAAAEITESLLGVWATTEIHESQARF